MTDPQYITFVGRDEDGASIDVTVVWVQTQAGATVFRDQFGPALPGVGPRTVPISPGSYKMTAQADGFIFPYLQDLTVPNGIAPVASDPLVVYIDGVSSKRQGTSFSFKVYGWLRTPSENAVPGQELQAPGTVYDDGPTAHTTSVNRTVWLETISPKTPGEQRSLVDRGRQRVTVDRHGYFEAYLEPQTLYAAILPTAVGKRYFETGDSGGSAELDTLIDDSLTKPLYTLV